MVPSSGSSTFLAKSTHNYNFYKTWRLKLNLIKIDKNSKSCSWWLYIQRLWYCCSARQQHVNTFTWFYVKKKGKAAPITGLCGPEGSGRLRPQISRHSAHEGGKAVTLTHRPRNIMVLIFRGWADPQGTRKCQLPQNKFQTSPLGIDPGSFRLVA